MIAEVRVPCGLRNTIPDLFIKFNSLLETACTHDLGTQDGAVGLRVTHVHTNTHTHAGHSLTHLITLAPLTPPPPPPQQHPSSSHHISCKLLMGGASVFFFSSSLRVCVSVCVFQPPCLCVFLCVFVFVFSKERRDNKSVT